MKRTYADMMAIVLRECIKAGLDGGARLSENLLKDCVHATIGVKRLAKETGLPVERLKRMYAPKGQLRLREMSKSFSVLSKIAGTPIRIEAA